MTTQVSSCSGTAAASRKGVDLVENACVALLAHIAREYIGQPEMRVARLGALAEARAAVRGAMPPFEHVALAKLLRRVQDDLRPRKARFQQDQRQHVLQLIPISGRPSALDSVRRAPTGAMRKADTAAMC